MNISASINYALKAMLYLARYGQERVNVKTISEKERISVKYLEQLLRQLKTAKLITSVRGKEGGYTLARPAHKILLLDIYEAIEGDFFISTHNDAKTAWFWEDLEYIIEQQLKISLEDFLLQQQKAVISYAI